MKKLLTIFLFLTAFTIKAQGLGIVNNVVHFNKTNAEVTTLTGLFLGDTYLSTDTPFTVYKVNKNGVAYVEQSEDLSNYVDKTSNQVVGGNKSFTGSSIFEDAQFDGSVLFDNDVEISGQAEIMLDVN